MDAPWNLPVDAWPWIIVAIVLVRAVISAARLQRARAQALQANDRLANALATIDEMAAHDPQTGLPNRSALHEALAQAVVRAGRAQSGLAVLFVDVDRFKALNRTLGQVVGDRALKEIGRRLASALPEGDFIGRLGGDQFLVVAQDAAHAGHPEAAALRLLRAMDSPVIADGHALALSCSVGVAHFPRDGRDAEALITHASIAMFRAKEQGRGRSADFSAPVPAAGREERPLEAALREAIEGGQLELHYQPQVGFRDGRVTGAEALLRWRHPEHGLVAPDRFLPIAQELGLSAQLDTWVLDEVFAAARRWKGEGASIPLSVNLSAAQLAAPAFADELAALASDAGIDPGLVRLEVAATLVAKDRAAAHAQMQALCAAGFPLALDDFGSGHSALAHLERVPLAELKLEPGFIRDLPLDAGAIAVARTLVDLAHSLGVRVVAEGVEQEAQFQLLRDEGCDAFQGFYCCPPLPEQEFLRFVFPERALLEGARAREAAIAA